MIVKSNLEHGHSEIHIVLVYAHRRFDTKTIAVQPALSQNQSHDLAITENGIQIFGGHPFVFCDQFHADHQPFATYIPNNVSVFVTKQSKLVDQISSNFMAILLQLFVVDYVQYSGSNRTCQWVAAKSVVIRSRCQSLCNFGVGSYCSQGETISDSFGHRHWKNQRLHEMFHFDSNSPISGTIPCAWNPQKCEPRRPKPVWTSSLMNKPPRRRTMKHSNSTTAILHHKTHPFLVLSSNNQLGIGSPHQRPEWIPQKIQQLFLA